MQSTGKFRNVKILTNAWHAFPLQGGTCFLFTTRQIIKKKKSISSVEMAVLLTLLWRTYSTDAGESGRKKFRRGHQHQQTWRPQKTRWMISVSFLIEEKNPFTSIKAKDTPEKVQNRKVSCQLGSWNKDKKIVEWWGEDEPMIQSIPLHLSNVVEGVNCMVWTCMVDNETDLQVFTEELTAG